MCFYTYDSLWYCKRVKNRVVTYLFSLKSKRLVPSMAAIWIKSWKSILVISFFIFIPRRYYRYRLTRKPRVRTCGFFIYGVVQKRIHLEYLLFYFTSNWLAFIHLGALTRNRTLIIQGLKFEGKGNWDRYREVANRIITGLVIKRSRQCQHINIF